MSPRSRVRAIGGLMVAAACAASQAGCDDAGGGGDLPPVIDEVAVEIVGACRLVARVTWTTDRPSTSRVEFGEHGQLTRFVEDDAAVTRHDLLVVGLPPETEITFEVVSATDTSPPARSDPVVATTGTFVRPELQTEISILDEALVQPGWTLTNLVVTDSLAPSIALLLDERGRVVWFHELGPADGSADIEVTGTAGGGVLIGGGVAAGYRPVEIDWLGQILWEGPVQPEGLAVQDGMHHTFQKLDDGRYLTLMFEFVDGHLTDRVAVLDASGSADWTWSSYPALEPVGSGEFHGNMALLDDDDAYFSCKDSRIYRIDRSTGEVDWALGDGGDFTFSGSHDHPWFERSHGMTLTGEHALLMYDNGIDRDYSRAVEYSWDEDAMTAEIVWEFDGGDGGRWHTTVWGDADRLDNGNTLIVAGSMLEDDSASRMMEVTAGGDVVWQMTMSTTTGDLAGSYMAQRIPALSQPIEE